MNMFVFIIVSLVFSTVVRDAHSGGKSNYSREAIAKEKPGFGTEWIFIETGDGEYEIGYFGGEPNVSCRLLLFIYGYDEPSEKNIQFTLYQRYLDSEIVTANNVSRSQFDSGRKTVFCAHGWMSNGKKDTCQSIKNNYIANPNYNYNIFIVDWSYFSGAYNYKRAKDQMPRIAKFYAQFIEALEGQGANPKDMHLIGHSLGAHLSGLTAKIMPVVPARITGLDPAKPWFNNPNKRLNSTDADFVDVVHTCGKFLGLFDPIGHLDLYPNGGSAPQPGCHAVSELAEPCSHGMSWKYYAASLLPDNSIGAWKCQSYDEFKESKDNCYDFTLIGEEANLESRGNFYFDTLPSHPYKICDDECQ